MRYILLTGILTAGLFLVSCSPHHGPMGTGYGPMGPGGGWQHMFGYGGGFIMWIFWIVILAVLGYGVYYFLNQKNKSDSPLEILKKRYARGEITKEEFDKMKQDL